MTLLLVSSDFSNTVNGLLTRAERSIFVVLLFLIGLHVNIRNGVAWIAALAVVGTRVLGKILGARIARNIAGVDLILPREPGLALIAYGPLALCITADYSLLVSGRNTHWLLDVAALAALGSEFLAASLFRFSTEKLTLSPERKRASVA